MRCIVVLSALLIFTADLPGQVLPWRRQVEQRLQHQEQLIAQLLQQRPQPSPQAPIIIVPEGPKQQLPIPGEPRQQLPIAGEPKQLLPSPGEPKQPLPVPGEPKQQLPSPADPRQPLPQPGGPTQPLPVPQGPPQLLPKMPPAADTQRYSLRITALYRTQWID